MYINDRTAAPRAGDFRASPWSTENCSESARYPDLRRSLGDFDRRKLNRYRDLATLSRSFAANSARNFRNTVQSKNLQRSAVAILNDTFAFDKVEKRAGHYSENFDGQEARNQS
jgi:hypothetical protein